MTQYLPRINVERPRTGAHSSYPPQMQYNVLSPQWDAMAQEARMANVISNPDYNRYINQSQRLSAGTKRANAEWMRAGGSNDHAAAFDMMMSNPEVQYAEGFSSVRQAPPGGKVPGPIWAVGIALVVVGVVAMMAK